MASRCYDFELLLKAVRLITFLTDEPNICFDLVRNSVGFEYGMMRQTQPSTSGQHKVDICSYRSFSSVDTYPFILLVNKNPVPPSYGRKTTLLRACCERCIGSIS